MLFLYHSVKNESVYKYNVNKRAFSSYINGISKGIIIKIIITAIFANGG